MIEFTLDQLNLLKEFTPETIAYAHKVLQDNVAAGRQVAHPFAFLLGVCKKQQHNKTLKREGQRLSQDVNQWQQKSQEQESYEFRERMYNIRKKLYDRGFKWQGETYGEMGLILKGYLPGRQREPHEPPPFL